MVGISLQLRSPKRSLQALIPCSSGSTRTSSGGLRTMKQVALISGKIIWLSKKTAQTVIISVLSFSFAGINLPAVNRLRDRAEIPSDTMLTIEFLLSFLAQFPLGDKLGHEYHLPSYGTGNIIILCFLFQWWAPVTRFYWRRRTPRNTAFPAKIR